MAIGTPVVLASGEVASGAGLSVLTPSFSPPANQLILAFVANSDTDGSPGTPTISGNGLTWTQVASLVTPDNMPRLTVFRAVGASPSTGQATINFGDSSTDVVEYLIIAVSGTKISGTNGSDGIKQVKTGTSTVSQPTVTFDLALEQGNAVFAAFAVDSATPGHTPEAGYTEIFDDGSPGSGNAEETRMSVIYRLNVADNSPSTNGDADNWAIVALELAAAPVAQTGHQSVGRGIARGIGRGAR